MTAEYARAESEGSEEHAARLLRLLELRDSELEAARRRLVQAGVDLPGGLTEAEGASADIPAGSPASGLEEVEAQLVKKSRAAQSPAVLELLKGLQAAAVYTDAPNHETNRKLWDAYARGWAPNQAWVTKMAGHLPGGGPEAVSCVGEEWSDEPSLHEVLEKWLFPHLEAGKTRVAEIGSGGGRVSVQVAPRVQELVCFDLSAEMLKAAKKHLDADGAKNVRFQQIEGDADYPSEFDASFDFVFSFDVFVHLDLHQMRRSLRSMRRMLRPGGLCFVSFANLLSPDGWRRFARQAHYSVGGFYFVSPDIARCLLTRSGFEVLSVSTPQQGNTYLNRDFLVLARRSADVAGTSDKGVGAAEAAASPAGT
eukprot:TRINITY_DN40771_c0_g1_i1.p1 TRINITY_DN40771_c0_g1~~TRINITY_DN40771_c0_g1_i1.p1  ORF type:complete len:392 (-),score=70.17 TRINITY_DN40771_c0_g1_i1:31-1131(-)